MSHSTKLSAALVAATLTLSGPAVAWAADWKTSFPGDSVAAHADASSKNVAVLAVGKRARPAAAAIRAALKQDGSIDRMRDGASLGSLNGLSDPEIVTKAAALDVDRYLIVRIFSEDEVEAVVSIYDREGGTIGGFSARPGEPVDAPRGGIVGHDSDLAESIASVEDDVGRTNEEFERQQVVFDQSFSVVSNGSTATVMRQFHPRAGDGTPLPGAEFYRYVGRDDLASKFSKRRAARLGLGIGGGVTSVAGLGVMLGYGLGKSLAVAGRTCDGDYDSPMNEACEANKDEESKRALRIGFGAGSALLVGGVVMSVIAARINPHPVSSHEAVGLAQGFNDALRSKLGLPKRKPGRGATASVSAGPQGAGFQIKGRF